MSDLRLSRATHDRAAHVRLDPVRLAAAWSDPRARIVQVHDSAALLVEDGSDLAYLMTDQIDLQNQQLTFLGFDPEGVPYFSIDQELVPAEGQCVRQLREISSRLPAGPSGLFVHAV